MSRSPREDELDFLGGCALAFYGFFVGGVAGFIIGFFASGPSDFGAWGLVGIFPGALFGAIWFPLVASAIRTWRRERAKSRSRLASTEGPTPLMRETYRPDAIGVGVADVRPMNDELDGLSSGRRAFYISLFFSLLLAAGLGGATLLFWGIHMTDPCPCSGDFCIFGNPAAGGADAHLVGTVPGLLYAGIGLLIVSGYVVWQFRRRLSHPFLSLIVGFPVLYGCLLASSWAVARVVWGPTRC